MRKWMSVAVMASLGGVSVAARAQGWVKMPNGSLAYTANYTTSGMFSCGNARFIFGRCLSFGNSVVLSTGNSTATITFNPVNSTLIAPSTRGRAMAVGTLSTVFSGSGPNQFPKVISRSAPLFTLGIGITTTSPMVATTSIGRAFTWRPYGLASYNLWGNVAVLPITPPPPPAGYGAMQIYGLPYSTIEPLDHEEELAARVSVTPEPATIALLGSGLLGVFGVAGRRAKQIRSKATAEFV